MNTERMDFKWTTSRGYETYGWNICSIYLNGTKQNQNCGGGYDMKGTALADYIEKNYQHRLLKLYRRAYHGYSVRMIYTPQIAKENNWTGGKYKRLKGNDSGFYGLTSYKYRGNKTPFKMGLDGGCGFESMQRICSAIGLKLHYTGGTNNTTNYILEDTRA